jgi:hypothetical protein
VPSLAVTRPTLEDMYLSLVNDDGGSEQP